MRGSWTPGMLPPMAMASSPARPRSSRPITTASLPFMAASPAPLAIPPMTRRHFSRGQQRRQPGPDRPRRSHRAGWKWNLRNQRRVLDRLWPRQSKRFRDGRRFFAGIAGSNTVIPGTTSAFGIAIYTGNGSSLTQIARAGQTGMSGGGAIISIASVPVINHSGQVAFSVVVSHDSRTDGEQPIRIDLSERWRHPHRNRLPRRNTSRQLHRRARQLRGDQRQRHRRHFDPDRYQQPRQCGIGRDHPRKRQRAHGHRAQWPTLHAAASRSLPTSFPKCSP